MYDPKALRGLQDEVRALARELADGVERPVMRDGGEVTRHEVPALLDQLADAVATGMERTTGGGGSGGRTSPISEGVVDTLSQIESDVTALHVHATQIDGGTAKDRIRALAAMAGRWTNPEHVGTVLQFMRRWAREISSTLEPSARLSAPCPACGECFAQREQGGEWVRVPALVVDARRGCVCLACEHVWGPGQLRELAASLERVDGEEAA